MYTPREDPPPPNRYKLEYIGQGGEVKTMDINQLECMIETDMEAPDATARYRGRHLHKVVFEVHDHYVSVYYRQLMGFTMRVKDTCLALTTLQLMFEAVKARWARESFATLRRFAPCIPSDMEALIGEYMVPEEPAMYVFHGQNRQKDTPLNYIQIGYAVFKPFKFEGRVKGMRLEPGVLRDNAEILPPRIYISDHPTVHFHPSTSFPMAKRVFDIYNDAS